MTGSLNYDLDMTHSLNYDLDRYDTQFELWYRIIDMTGSLNYDLDMTHILNYRPRYDRQHSHVKHLEDIISILPFHMQPYLPVLTQLH